MDKQTAYAAQIRFRENLHKINGLFEGITKALGLNFTAVLVLEILYNSEASVTQKDLRERLVVPKQYINYIIKSLRTQGVIKLQENEDRRAKQIIFTDRGKEYAETIINSVHDIEIKAWDGFSDEDVLAFACIMEKYEKSFENALKNTIGL